MARISYVKAWGLWSHLESVFNFAPGLTVITGPNGSGKSGLISIIRWVFIGEPTGEEFIFKLEDEKTKEVIKQAEEGRAEVGLDNGIVITKTRRKGKTTYTISTVAEPFEKAEVPQEVKEALGIDLYKFGDFETYLNFAFQLEAPFLLSESPSVGAKVLGKLAGTEAVDLAIADQSKKAHKARDDKRIGEKEIEKLNGDLLAYQDIDDIKAQLDACDFLIDEVDKAAAKRSLLNDLTNKHFIATESITKLVEDLKPLENIEAVGVDLKAVEITWNKRNTLVEMYDNWAISTKTIQDLTAQLAIYEGIDVFASTVADIEGKEKRLTVISSLQKDYENYTTNIEQLNIFLATVKDLDVAAVDLHIYESKAVKHERLTDLSKALYLEESHVVTLNSDLSYFAGLDDAAAQIKEAGAKAEKLEDLQQLIREYNVKNILALQAAKDLEKADQDLTQAEADLKAAWDAAGGICPLCDQPLATHKH